MKECKVIVENRLGLHARPSAMLVQEASKFSSEIYLESDGIEVNGKSILGVMMLAAVEGTEVIIKADGEDEDEAIEAINALFKRKFDEE